MRSAQRQEQLGDPCWRFWITAGELSDARKPIRDRIRVQVETLRDRRQRRTVHHVLDQSRAQVRVRVERLKDGLRESPCNRSLAKDELFDEDLSVHRER